MSRRSHNAPEITRLEDGYGVELSCDDGAIVDLQVAREGVRTQTWEVLWSRGTESTLHGMSVEDIRQLGEALTALAECIQAKGR